MSKILRDVKDKDALRRRAEQNLIERRLEAPDKMADMQRLVHELQVHKIELELQNEELRAAQHEIEAGIRRYSDLYEFAPVGFFLLNRNGTIIEANLAGATLLGAPRLRLKGRLIHSYIYPASLSIFTALLNRMFLSNQEQTCEISLLPVDGNHPAIVHLTAIVDPSGQTWRLVAVDVSVRKRVEEDLASSLSTINYLDQAINEHAMVVITDRMGTITYVNEKFCAISQYSMEELLGRDSRTIEAGDHPQAFIGDIRIAIAQGRVWKGELRNIAKDGSLYWVDTTIVPFLDRSSRPYQYVAIHTDISERKKMEEALQLSHCQLRELAAHQNRVKEDERKRIAREIHDDLGQNLLALRIDVAMLHTRTGETHPRLHNKTAGVLENIDATVKSVRSIMNDLRPTSLDLGLQAAIEWQVAEFQKRNGIVCKLSMGGHEFFATLDDDRATALFRILQESLANVIRHAQASLVSVKVSGSETGLTLAVIDNGVGLRPGCRRKANHFGLIGIEERVLSLGGTFTIGSPEKFGGTAVLIQIPFESMPGANDVAAGQHQFHF